MKTGKKIVIAICAAAVLLITIPLVTVQIINAREYAKFSTAETGSVNTDIFAVKDDIVNLYLVRTASGWIAFDSGYDPKSVARQLEDRDIDPDSVQALFLTHSDFDHAGGASAFPKAAIYLNALEEPLATGKIVRNFIFRNSFKLPHTLLADGETVTVDGRSVTIISVPGHTPGSSAYLVDGAYLFTGDNFAIRNGKIEQFNKVYTMDTALQLKSIHRLTGLKDAKLILTAHYGVSDQSAALFSDYESR
jgi:glyoxylase-like metal-dependent hydrolase (beta-lactamase superfamily II)